MKETCLLIFITFIALICNPDGGGGLTNQHFSFIGYTRFVVQHHPIPPEANLPHKSIRIFEGWPDVFQWNFVHVDGFSASLVGDVRQWKAGKCCMFPTTWRKVVCSGTNDYMKKRAEKKESWQYFKSLFLFVSKIQLHVCLSHSLLVQCIHGSC